MDTAHPSQDETPVAQKIEQRAFELVNGHDHFRGQARRFSFTYRDKVLIVRGSVPSFYLKQVLQSVLKDVSDARIDNQVTVSPIDRYLGRHLMLI